MDTRARQEIGRHCEGLVMGTGGIRGEQEKGDCLYLEEEATFQDRRHKARHRSLGDLIE